MYGDQLNKIDNAIEKAASIYSKNLSYDQAVGKINEFIGGNTEKRISALFEISANPLVLEWATVTVQFSFIKSDCIGFPTILDLPITTAW